MSAIPYVDPSVVPADVPTHTVEAVSRHLGVSTSKVLQMVRDHELIAVRRDGSLCVPKVFFAEIDGRFAVAKHLTGLIRLLHDGGYSDSDVMRWLFTVQSDLVGWGGPAEGATPADTLHTDGAREVMRRAQSLAF
ncbi:Rv2175c family DNA-binding protein [Tsukamurella soli]|uniref:Rv2175c family DNA-binding protein n=1 Tax=Tsukamurella soli TaxID=644556 RepID=A0ABP8JGM2_9ACTN